MTGGAAAVLTSSPYKNSLEQYHIEKEKKNQKILKVKLPKRKNNADEEKTDKSKKRKTTREIAVSPKKARKGATNTDKSNAKQRKQISRQNTIEETAITSKKRKITQKKSSKEPVISSTVSSDNTPCSICGIRYCDPPYDNWRQCLKCSSWFHVSCGLEDIDLCYMCVD
jgi:spore germination cell wall hydrolase CwlJ-like protein